MTSSAAVSPTPRLAPTIAVVWFALAVVLGASGRLLALPFPTPQLLILVLTAAAVVVGSRVAAVRTWIDALPLRGIVAVHGLRLVAGVWFLILAAQGALAPVFAERAGWGDIVVAVLALALVLSGPPGTPARRRLYLIWNMIGLLDFVVVIATAAWVAGMGLEPGVEPLLRLPLSLIPTFIVPVLFASHVFLFRRLRAS